MALTIRQKKGIGYFIGGVLAAFAGIMIYSFTGFPLWATAIIQAVGLVGTTFGFTIALPNTTD